jgi:hypothetical protein
MLHLLDPSRVQSPTIASGYNPPQEIHRWIFRESLKKPLIW